jgi:hypothetical protein
LIICGDSFRFCILFRRFLVQRAVFDGQPAQCLLVGDLIRPNVSLATCWRNVALIFRSY